MTEGAEPVEEDDEGSVEVLKGELESEKRKNQDLQTRLKYAQADLENYRKRVDKEAKETSEAAVRSLVSRLLEVSDELDLASKHVSGQGGELAEGIKMVQKNLASALDFAGAERIECVGKRFDPSLHEAVEKEQGESEGEDRVVEELRAGYTFRGRLMRPSMVKVELARRGPSEEKADE